MCPLVEPWQRVPRPHRRPVREAEAGRWRTGDAVHLSSSHDFLCARIPVYPLGHRATGYEPVGRRLATSRWWRWVYSRIMARSIRFKKQYKPIGFGDAYDPRSVEGHHNAVRDAIENRRAARELKALEAEGEVAKPLWLRVLVGLGRLMRRSAR
jgi:hypothetical protein